MAYKTLFLSPDNNNNGHSDNENENDLPGEIVGEYQLRHQKAIMAAKNERLSEIVRTILPDNRLIEELEEVSLIVYLCNCQK